LQRIAELVDQGAREGASIWRPKAPVPTQGCFYPPTLVTDVEPASMLAEVEIFGPVLVAMTFRTPEEAVALANNTRYGLAASVWSENVNRSLEVAAQIKAGVVWINSTNLFDAASGFGGYRESGFGREGGREGLAEYLAPVKRAGKAAAKERRPATLSALPGQDAAAYDGAAAIDRTAKMYVGGKQARPDAGYSYAVVDNHGLAVGHAGLGNRKDIRNAVEAAGKAASWGAATGHNRAHVLYYLAENLSARAAEFAARLVAMTGVSAEKAEAEVDAAIRRTFYYAGFADKYDGAIHATRSRHITLAMNEPWGIMGVVCPDEAPLLALMSLVMPAVAMGNRVVVVPSSLHPLAATDLYQVIDTSDVPGGVVNIVTGERDSLAKVLAEHEGVDALWYCGTPEGAKMVEAASVSNLKATWTDGGPARDWLPAENQGRAFLRRATQVKNIWTPYGE
jgi:aldehyde dehydrogenase (NAD+)